MRRPRSFRRMGCSRRRGKEIFVEMRKCPACVPMTLHMPAAGKPRQHALVVQGCHCSRCNGSSSSLRARDTEFFRWINHRRPERSRRPSVGAESCGLASPLARKSLERKHFLREARLDCADVGTPPTVAALTAILRTGGHSQHHPKCLRSRRHQPLSARPRV